MSEYKDLLVAIIVPVYNTGKYVRECIDSIINQTYSNFKCCLINDGSTDNSLELITNHTKNDSRFIILNQKNKGHRVVFKTNNRKLALNLHCKL